MAFLSDVVDATPRSIPDDVAVAPGSFEPPGGVGYPDFDQAQIPCSVYSTHADFEQSLSRTLSEVVVIDFPHVSASDIQRFRRLRPGSRLLVVVEPKTTPFVRADYLDSGADMVLSSPLHPGELSAGIAALVRRLPQAQAATAGLPSTMTPPPESGWALNAPKGVLLNPAGQSLLLTRAELLVLETLAAIAPAIASRKMLVEALGQSYLDYDERCLETLVSRLRRKRHHQGDGALPIRSFRNRGYAFTEPIQVFGRA